MSAALRVLVADDELMARKRLLRLLGDLEGVEICGECRSAAEVLKRVAVGGVGAVLLDIQMPELTGMDALKLLPLTRAGRSLADPMEREVAPHLFRPAQGATNRPVIVATERAPRVSQPSSGARRSRAQRKRFLIRR